MWSFFLSTLLKLCNIWTFIFIHTEKKKKKSLSTESATLNLSIKTGSVYTVEGSIRCFAFFCSHFGYGLMIWSRAHDTTLEPLHCMTIIFWNEWIYEIQINEMIISLLVLCVELFPLQNSIKLTKRGSSFVFAYPDFFFFLQQTRNIILWVDGSMLNSNIYICSIHIEKYFNDDFPFFSHWNIPMENVQTVTALNPQIFFLRKVKIWKMKLNFWFNEHVVVISFY